MYRCYLQLPIMIWDSHLHCVLNAGSSLPTGRQRFRLSKTSHGSWSASHSRSSRLMADVAKSYARSTDRITGKAVPRIKLFSIQFKNCYFQCSWDFWLHFVSEPSLKYFQSEYFHPADIPWLNLNSIYLWDWITSIYEYLTISAWMLACILENMRKIPHYRATVDWTFERWFIGSQIESQNHRIPSLHFPNVDLASTSCDCAADTLVRKQWCNVPRQPGS